MPALASIEYAILRVVPRVEREEHINVGAAVFCADHEILLTRIELDEARLVALFPDVDIANIRAHLEAFERVGAGDADAGPIAQLPIRERWRWLVSPRSDVLQTSAPHAGLCEDPSRFIERLLDVHVR